MRAPFELSSSLRGYWPAAVASVMPLLGCGPGGVDTEVFRIASVAYDNEDTLTLTFTRPIANADEIDPNDFRISLGRSYQFTYMGPSDTVPTTYTSTYYLDLYAYTGMYNYNDQRFSFKSASLGAPDQLVLEMTSPLGTYVCEQIEYYENQVAMYLAEYPGSQFEMAMFVHYAGQDIPLLGDNGEALPDIGPDWVLSDLSYLSNEIFGFTKLNPKLEIPCP